MVTDFEEERSKKENVSKDSLGVPVFMAPLSHLHHADQRVVILLSPESVYTDLYKNA